MDGKSRKTFLAADLGAGSGRVVAGSFDGSRLRADTLHRFENNPTEIAGHYHWNAQALLTGIREGLRKASVEGRDPVSIGVDTWGVDYGLLDREGRLLGLPYMYRDSRTDGMLERFCAIYGRRELYQRTGIQFMEINTLFQLYAEALNPDSLLSKADRLLMMPDLLNYWLSGVKANEATIASTGQMIALDSRDWAGDVIRAAGAPEHLFGPLVRPGTVLGDVLGAPGVKTVAVGGHDTASAVLAVPAGRGYSWGYLSTGTWALMGVELDEPVLSDAGYALQFTHEGGVSGNLRFLKNITGLWLIQELRRSWNEQGEDIDYDTMTRMAEESEPFACFIDPDDPAFATPGDMPARFADYLKRTGQPVPAEKGAFVRAAFEGLALRYGEVWSRIEELTGVKRDVLHMIGGGTRDSLHCQMTADSLNTTVVCGPVEGAATGNILAQMIASGDLAGVEEARGLVRESAVLVTYEPRRNDMWSEARERWQSVKRRSA